jgi:IS605 OrfB family transposase
MPTYSELLPQSLDAFLDATSSLYATLEHEMHAMTSKGMAVGKVEHILQSRHKVDFTTTRNVWHNLKGKQRSIAELREINAQDIQHSIKSIGKNIKALCKSIKAKRKKGENASKDEFTLHQKKRRLDIKHHRLRQAKTNTSLCFGSKKLFNVQHHLEENGYATHEEWLEDWRSARTSSFMMVGSKIYQGGNQLCRLTPEGNLRITVPLALREQFGDFVFCAGVQFRYGQEWINAALEPKSYISKGKKKSSRIGSTAPVTHRFCKKDDRWYIHTTVELPEVPWVSSKANGAIGVDLNVDNIAWAYCDHNGNLKTHGQIAIDLQGKSSNQTRDILSKAVSEIITLARTWNCPIVIEKLDFSKKKASLREQGKRYAEMLSSFAYSKFGELVRSKCYMAGIQVIELNPAYSSLIGLTKFMSMYGLNSGTAAGLVLARRCFRFSERLPLPVRTLVSPVDGARHTWSSWSRAAKKLKGSTRHSYFAMRVRVEVKSAIGLLEEISIGKVVDKSKDTSVIPSEVGALPSRSSLSGLPSFAQLCLDF